MEFSKLVEFSKMAPRRIPCDPIIGTVDYPLFFVKSGNRTIDTGLFCGLCFCEWFVILLGRHRPCTFDYVRSRLAA